MPCLYIVAGATSARSCSWPRCDCDWCGSKIRVHVSSRMCFGVGSMGTRDESGAMCARTWLGVSSGMQSSTWSWRVDGRTVVDNAR